MNNSSSGIAPDVRISPMWVIGPLAVLGIPAVFVIEILSGALEIEMAAFILLFYVALGVTWLLNNREHLVDSWFMVIVFVCLIFLALSWWKSPELLILMVIPPVLAAVLISRSVMLIVAIGETIFLLIWPNLVVSNVSLATTMAVLVTTWAILGLLAAAYHQVYQLVQWSWQNSQRAQVLLEQSRTHQVELQQASIDLAQANQQLTRINELAQGLRRMAEEARSSKETFVAQVSHELRTPLNMIIGYSEVMLKSPEIYGRNLPSALLADLNVVFKNAEHLSGLIDDVLDLAEIETEQPALSKEEVQLHAIVNAATLAVRPLFESKGLYLKVDVPEQLPPLFCDRARIRQVMLNLLSNAGRFTEKGGVRVKAWLKNRDLVVSVTDTGPGIAAEDQVKLFKPFQQISSSIRQQHGGSGLGLSISKRLLELHGGDIWVDSTVGVGTTFSFLLPIALPMPTPDEITRWLQPEWEFRQRTGPSQAPKVVTRPRFDVLDKGNTLLRFLTRYLADSEVVPVSSLEQAIHGLSDIPGTALVINDISVNETLQQLESADLPDGIPIMICSVPNAAEFATTLGVFDFLMKPVSRKVLLATLDRLGGDTETLLIVDDQPDTIRLYRRMLTASKRDYQVIQATDSRTAKKILDRRKPDVILLDLDLPKMDGLQFLKAWDNDPSLRSIPVIVASSYDPSSRPAVSNVFAVTQEKGLSTMELLLLIKQTAKLLSTIAPSDDPTQPTTHSAGLACE